MPFVVRQVESTPNPSAKKLVLDRVISADPLSFHTPADADGHPLAGPLMALTGVVGVLLLNDFVTLNKSPDAKWGDITAKAKRILAKA